VLDDLRAHADVILVDSPPLTQVSDALSLTPHVDAVIVVARPKLVNRRALNDLVRLLGSAPVPVLGFVATGIDSESGYYGYGYGKTRGEESQTPEGDDYTAKSLP
jgi:Mrp family chromosome partitioning ATPase